MSLIKKKPGERRLFVFDFGDFPEVSSGETIGTPVVTVPDDITQEDAAVTAVDWLVAAGDIVPAGKGVEVWLSGGTDLTDYQLLCHVTTSGGAGIEVGGVLRVRARD